MMKLFQKKKKNNKGFSLVELIVVVAIMAVLMAILIPTLIRYVDKTNVQKDFSAIEEIRSQTENVVVSSVNGKDGVTEPSFASGVISVTDKEIAQNINGEGSTSYTYTLGSSLKDKVENITYDIAPTGKVTVDIKLNSDVDKDTYANNVSGDKITFSGGK